MTKCQSLPIGTLFDFATLARTSNINPAPGVTLSFSGVILNFSGVILSEAKDL